MGICGVQRVVGALCTTFVVSMMNSTMACDGGIFGAWGADKAGLPVYEYTLDQHADDRAEFGQDIGAPARLHWHQIGNDRIVAIGANDGWGQVYSHEDGPRWINQYRAEDGNLVELDTARQAFLKRKS